MSGAMIAAEVLRLRRRRVLVWVSMFLLIGTVLLTIIGRALAHQYDPGKFGPASGDQALDLYLGLISAFGGLAAVIIGATAGSADHSAGVFRDLVATGRSRLALYFVRIPGTLVFIGALAAVGAALGIAAGALSSAGSIDAGQIWGHLAFIAITLTVYAVLALSVATAVGSRGIAIGIILGLVFVLDPILVLLAVRQEIDYGPLALAMGAFDPSVGEGSGSPGRVGSALVLAGWLLVANALACWRLLRRDA